MTNFILGAIVGGLAVFFAVGWETRKAERAEGGE